MSATCLTQPATPAAPPPMSDGPSIAAAPDALSTRVRTLRYVQHPSFRATPAPSDRAWELDARRPVRGRTAA